MEARTPMHLTTDDLSLLCAVHPSTLVKRRCDGDLPQPHGNPGHLYWTAEQLIEWAADRTRHMSEAQVRLAVALARPQLCERGSTY